MLKNVEDTLREDKSISPQIRVMMKLLVVVINLLLDRLGPNSKNCSTSPSKDPKRKPGSKRKAKGEKRKPGGQNGHEGTTFKKVPNPDHVEIIKIDRRTIPSGSYTSVGFESRQVLDIKISTEVTEHHKAAYNLLEDFEAIVKNRLIAQELLNVDVTRH